MVVRLYSLFVCVGGSLVGCNGVGGGEGRVGWGEGVVLSTLSLPLCPSRSLSCVCWLGWVVSGLGWSVGVGGVRVSGVWARGLAGWSELVWVGLGWVGLGG